LGLDRQDRLAFPLDHLTQPFRTDADLRQMMQMRGGLAKALLRDRHTRTHPADAETDAMGDDAQDLIETLVTAVTLRPPIDTLDADVAVDRVTTNRLAALVPGRRRVRVQLRGKKQLPLRLFSSEWPSQRSSVLIATSPGEPAPHCHR